MEAQYSDDSYTYRSEHPVLQLADRNMDPSSTFSRYFKCVSSNVNIV